MLYPTDVQICMWTGSLNRLRRSERCHEPYVVNFANLPNTLFYSNTGVAKIKDLDLARINSQLKSVKLTYCDRGTDTFHKPELHRGQQGSDATVLKL
jgi:hypothetical protein